MANDAKIYEGVEGLVIDAHINNVESFTGMVNYKFFVIPPDTKIEEEWPVTLEMNDLVFRHVCPPEKKLVKGTYKIQPYFELGTFKGRWGTFLLVLHKNYT
jgi:hypothetical protein